MANPVVAYQNTVVGIFGSKFDFNILESAKGILRRDFLTPSPIIGRQFLHFLTDHTQTSDTWGGPLIKFFIRSIKFWSVFKISKKKHVDVRNFELEEDPGHFQKCETEPRQKYEYLNMIDNRGKNAKPPF